METKQRVNIYITKEVWDFAGKQAKELGISRSVLIERVLLGQIRLDPPIQRSRIIHRGTIPIPETIYPLTNKSLVEELDKLFERVKHFINESNITIIKGEENNESKDDNLHRERCFGGMG